MKLKNSTNLNIALLVVLMLAAKNGSTTALAQTTPEANRSPVTTGDKPAADKAADDKTESDKPASSEPKKENSKPPGDKPKVQHIPAGKPVNIGKQRAMQLPEAASLFFINKLGKQAIPYMFYDASPFQEGLAAALIADQWGYIDKEGNVQIGADFDQAGEFAEGLAPVKVKDKWGYIDHTGKFAIEPRFAVAEGFKNGYAAVQLSKDSPEFPQKANDQLQNILKDPDMPSLKKAWLAIASSRAAGIIDKKGLVRVDPCNYSNFHIQSSK